MVLQKATAIRYAVAYRAFSFRVEATLQPLYRDDKCLPTEWIERFAGVVDILA